MSIIDPTRPGNFNLAELKSPADIRTLNFEQLNHLAAELRTPLLQKLAAVGGHVGPNLGFVEATIALHYVFNTPEDKIVFDVSHQTYVHKMLTGRIASFLDPAKYRDVTGYTNPHESAYDLFSIGHTSTSLALAAGLAKARDMQGGHENVVAVIGDGSLSGGEAFEGLDYGALLNSNFIVVVNDNQMSIAPNHGGIYQNLELLRNTNGTAECNLFRSFGYDYIYVGEGNNIDKLVEAFRAVKDSTRPVVVHINTFKGLGLPVAERHKEQFHWSMPFDPKTGEPLQHNSAPNYFDLFANHMLNRMAVDKNICTITAGTPGAIGFDPARREAAHGRFIDVGIAEQCAVALASGIAKGGCRPVFGVQASFLQRAYDQLQEDVAINSNPAVFVVFNSSVWGIPDETHLGFFSAPMSATIPGLPILAPTNGDEFTAMLDWAIDQTETPVMIIAPAVAVAKAEKPVATDYSHATYDIERQGADVAIIAAGDFIGIGREAAALMEQQGLNPTLINPRIISDVDAATLNTLRDYKLVVTLEDNSIAGGMGQKIAAYLGTAPVKVKSLGLPKAFLNRYKASEVLAQQGITPEAIAALATSL